VISAVRTRFEGAGCLGAIALLLCVLGVLALLLELQSPTAVLWTGRAVVAEDRGGVVLYPVNGHNYTLIMPNEPANTPAHRVTVFLDPSNPTAALADSASTRWFDAAFVSTPFIVAGALFALALMRNSRRVRWRSQQARSRGGGFGQGFDVEQFRTRQPRGGDPRGGPPHDPA
jgi:hypothetical protein